MASKKAMFSKNFFLISFLPALAYWYLESRYEPRIAVTGGVVLACIEMGLEKIFIKHVHTISKFNFYLIIFLGVLSFMDNEGLWFKLQPLLTGLGVGGFLLWRVWRGKGLLWEMLESMGRTQSLPPQEVLMMFEYHVALFFIVYGIFMAFLAIYFSTSLWAFFKTLGFYIVAFFFMGCEIIWLRWKLKQIARKRYRDLVAKF